MNLLDYRISEKIWKISSDCVQDDHYLLDNLISSDESKRRIGFMAFSVSKPPISIVLECRLKINLESLVVHSVLNSLKATRLQIMTEFTENGVAKTKTITEVTLEEEFSGFCLKATQSTQSHGPSIKCIKLDNYLKKYLADFKKLIIVVKDTNFKRSPVLNKIEMFGTFSKSNRQIDVQEILSLLCDKIEITNFSADSQSDDCEADNSLKIPEEFLDAITLELLNLPYILPSGSVVDETTLEKHKQNEASHGRFPSDPFTGLLYTKDSQPKFDAALKVRLDQFKLRNSDQIEIMNSGRSVGRKEKLCEPSTSKQFNSHVSKKIKLNKESSSLDDIIQSIYRNKQITSFIQPQKMTNDKNLFCIKCSNKEIMNLYKISTCSHVFCRKCLKALNLICSGCSKGFENRNVFKINL